MKEWQFILQKVQENIPVMLLYVLESNGSSPGRQGFKMAIAADGEMSGSIGGGIMEHKFVELAKARLAGSHHHSLLQKQVHDKSAPGNQSGMICSGDQTIWMYSVKPSDKTTLASIIESITQLKNGCLTLTADRIDFSNEVPDNDFLFEQYDTNRFQLKEKTGFKNTLHVIGGGHCALALCELVSRLDFEIHVYDVRPGLNTMGQNKFAHHRTILENYESLTGKIAGGKNVYVVIMSFGYRTDSIAMKALWGKQFKYIGLLGSKKKIEKLFMDFEEEGLDPSYIQKIHSPIGLPIHSKTPAEIAISISAEIIAVKNKDQ